MSRVSTIVDGEKVYPFEPPSLRGWAKIVKRVRTEWPLPYRVQIIRSVVAPDGTMCDAGSVNMWHKRGKTTRARIWVNSRLRRGDAIDTLLHEWAHLMSDIGRPGDDMPHDDKFWLTFGRLYREWLKET